MCLGVPLLSMDEVWELGTIADEEDGCVIEHPVPVPILGSDLRRETTGITSSICTPRFATDG